ncbi:hypothetical protein MJO28_010645 [Puccinia striiformis f. sp. tritici]|uniref:Uncharacterized protein n=1 Tax=Puccinia striiformis f. sp. tritici TaxID=168172 RepID=A0ACC0E796_9BASI|nr:hypothetical protein MJO28_010645 [Puccinia striiformis f. sp. tritici]
MSSNSHINPLLLQAPPQETLIAPSTNPHALAPPPELTYKTKEELQASAQKWAREHCYAISVGHSNYGNGENRTSYQCDRSGTREAKSDGKLGKTQKTDCPFKFNGNFYKKRGVFQIKIINPQHNHPPSEDPSTHSVHRRLNEENKAMVAQLTHAGVPPLKIKSALMQNSSAPTSVTLNTIYNARNAMRMTELEGKSPMEALVHELRKQDFHYSMLTHEGQMKSLFFAHPQSLILAKRFPTTIILDCTYKVNKYKMPLLHIVGINSSNRNFCIAFCFLSAETKGDYSWALEQLLSSMDNQSPSVFVTDNEQALINAINLVFPDSSHHLCTWHVWNNIDSNCSKSFKSDKEFTTFKNAWTTLIQSPSEADYHKNFTNLSMTWNPQTSDYVLKNIIPLKEKIVAYCINKHPHFGNTVTSRVEGAHAYLKRFIHTSTGSFYAVVKQIHQALNNQLHERFIESSQHSYKHLTGLPPCLANLSGPITHYAIKTVHALFLLDPPTSTCSGLYSSHMGMPCIHKIHQAKSEGLKLSPEDFHPQWRTQTFLAEEFPQLPEDENEEENTPPTKEKNEHFFLNTIFPKFQSFHAGEQQHLISEFQKLLSGTYTTTIILEPSKDHPKRGRPTKKEAERRSKEEEANKTELEENPAKEAPKPNHKSTTSTKRKPSAFELSGSGSKKRKGRGRPKKAVVENGDSLGKPPAQKKGRGRPRKEESAKKNQKEETAKKIHSEESERSGRELKELPLGLMKGNKHVVFDGDDNELFNPFGVQMTASSDTGPTTIVDTLASYSVGDHVEVEVYKKKNDIRPTSLIRHISTISDVEGDGNCGFRAAAVSMGQNSNEWKDIRKEMKKEFDNNPLYSDERFLENVWGEGKEDRIAALSWDKEGILAPKKFWMHFPSHPYLMADTFKRPVILFSEKGSNSYLPLSHSPTNESPIGLILLDNHLITFQFKAELWPSPRVDPFWVHYVQPVATPWEDFIQANLEKGNQVLFPPVRRSSRINPMVDVE